MKHASPETLAALHPLLNDLRALGRLIERTPGCFYLKSSAFLHFHEDRSGTHADVKLDGKAFTRMRVASKAEQARLLGAVRRCLGPGATAQRDSAPAQ